MKKALALLLAVLMLLSSVAIIASAEGEAQSVEINMQDLMGATYVGEALGADDAKPVQDGVVNEGEYQISYVIESGSADSVYSGDNGYNGGYSTYDEEESETPVPYTEYVAHDADYFYFAATYLQKDMDRVFWWVLSKSNSYVYDYDPTASHADMFTQNDGAIKRNSNVAIGVRHTAEDTFTHHNSADGVADAMSDGNIVLAMKQTAAGLKTYEYKISKTWLATQIGAASKDEVRNLSWYTWCHRLAGGGRYFTHEFTEAEKAALKAAHGADYTAGDDTFARLFVLDAEPVDVNLQAMYGATYVGAPLAADAAKPVQDGTISANEYQVSYVTTADGAGNATRFGAPIDLLDTFVQHVAHDADYLYVGVEFTSAKVNTRGRLYWNLSFIDSFDVTYSGGTTINQAFTQNGFGIVDGWYFGAEIAENPTTGTTDDYIYSARNGDNGTVTRGTAPAKDTDFVLVTDKVVLEPVEGSNAKTRQTYEFKVSKAWYAAQVGLDSAADVRNLAWAFQGEEINAGASSYTQIGHYITDAELAALNATGNTYVRSTTGSQPYDNASLPLLFILDEPTPIEVNLEDMYGATYVGAPLGADDAKPVQDGTINIGEYQAEYIVARGSMEEPAKDTARFGVPMMLLGDFKQFISHDDEWIYVGFAFSNGKENTRGRLYWNLSFIDSFDVTYYGGTTIAGAFKQGEYAINDGWNFGAEIKDVITENDDGSTYWDYSERNNAVTRGTAPVKDTDFAVTLNKVTPITLAGTNRQVYEFKVSKAWYAAQAGLESAADVRELAWVVLGEEINAAASSYTQIGHYLTAEELTLLKNMTGLKYVGNGSGHPYDNSMLPLLFVLDEDPNAEGEQTNVPAEIVEPMGAVPAPDEPDEGEGEGEDIVVPPTGDDNTTTTAPATTTAATTTAKATTAADTTAAATTAAAKKGCKASVAVSALVLLPTLAGGALLIKRRKED